MVLLIKRFETNMNIADYAYISIASILAGFINALAGGGTLITFPLLIALGVPPVTANITNTVALCPGYLGATLAQSGTLRDQKSRLRFFLPIGVIGGISGGLLLLHTPESLFEQTVPFLILIATIILSLQKRIHKWLESRNSGSVKSNEHSLIAVVMILLASVYGGYFGAGVSVIILAVLGIIIDDSLKRLNALKQAISLIVNAASAIYFIFSNHVLWPVALLMAFFSIAGGVIGGRMSDRIKEATLHSIVVAIGFLVSIYYFSHLFHFI